jgi:hypothetical protein
VKCYILPVTHPNNFFIFLFICYSAIQYSELGLAILAEDLNHVPAADWRRRYEIKTHSATFNTKASTVRTIKSIWFLLRTFCLKPPHCCGLPNSLDYRKGPNLLVLKKIVTVISFPFLSFFLSYLFTAQSLMLQCLCAIEIGKRHHWKKG